MGLLDELKKLTKPYDDEDYFEEDLAEPIRAPERRQQPGQRSYASYADYADYANPPQSQEDYNRGYNPQPNPGYNPYNAQQGYGAPQQGYSQPNYAAPQQGYSQPGYGAFNQDTGYGAFNQDAAYGAPAQARMLLVKPERFEEAADIADRLRERNTIILNLETTPKDVSRRLLDFLSGVTYALSGKIKRAAGNTYVITPAGMDFAGETTDGFENRGTYF